MTSTVATTMGVVWALAGALVVFAAVAEAQPRPASTASQVAPSQRRAIQARGRAKAKPPPAKRAHAADGALSRLARAAALPPWVGRSDKAHLRGLVEALRQGKRAAAERRWTKFVKRHRKRSAAELETINVWVLRQAFIAPRPELARVLQRRAMREQVEAYSRELEVAGTRAARNGTVRVAVKQLRAGALVTTDERALDAREIERRRQEMAQASRDAEDEAAKDVAEAAKEQFKAAMRIVTEHMERQSQVIQRITS